MRTNSLGELRDHAHTNHGTSGTYPLLAALLRLEVWLRHRAGEQDREVAYCLNNAPLCEAIEVCQAMSVALF